MGGAEVRFDKSLRQGTPFCGAGPRPAAASQAANLERSGSAAGLFAICSRRVNTFVTGDRDPGTTFLLQGSALGSHRIGPVLIKRSSNRRSVFAKRWSTARRSGTKTICSPGRDAWCAWGESGKGQSWRWASAWKKMPAQVRASLGATTAAGVRSRTEI